MRFLRNRNAIVIGLLLALALPAAAAPSIQTWVLKSTNGTFYGNSVTIAGKLLTFTNATASTTVLTNSTANGSATNLYSQLGQFRIAALTTSLLTNANTILLRGDGLVVTQTGNWCSLTAGTNSGPVITDYSWPVENIPDASARTNQLSDLVPALGKYPTNQVPMTAPAFANFINAGNASQVKTGALTIGTLSGNIGNLTNGNIKGSTLTGISIPSGSIGTTFGSEVLADQLVLDSGRILLRGGSGQTNAIAATDSGASLYSGRNTSTPLDMRTPDDPAAILNFWSAIRIFPNLASGIYIGTNLWNIQNDWFGVLNVFHEQLGATNFWAVFSSLTNSAFSGTNQWKGDIAWVHGTYSSMLNTNNTVPSFTNAVVDLSGSTTQHDIAGVAGGRAGKRQRFWDTGTLPLIIRNLSGGTAAGNAIRTRTGNDITLTNNPAGFELEYSATASEWLYVPIGN